MPCACCLCTSRAALQLVLHLALPHRHQQVKGYPTLKVLYKGEVIKDFRGPRELGNLKKFITEAADEVLTEAD